MTKSQSGYEKVAVVGSSGFVGSYLTGLLSRDGFNVTGMVRKALNDSLPHAVIEIGDILNPNDYDGVFKGIGTLVYTIARTHQVNEDGLDLEHVYNEINCDAMIKVAKAAQSQGVKRFVFLSSLKVLGEENLRGQSFCHDSVPCPRGPYGTSKLKAEKALIELGQLTGLEVVIIRPPLIYGMGVKGNLETLIRAIRFRIPLPFFFLTQNRRSLVSLENLCNLIKECIVNPLAKGEVFLVKDPENLSTVGVIKLLSKEIKIEPILFPLPDFILRGLLFLIGKKSIAQRLMGDLTVDDKYTKDTLGWVPKRYEDTFD